MTTGTVQDVGRTGSEPRDPRSFVDPQVWERQVALLVRDHPFDTVMAERLLGQAVAYLITAMEKWGEELEIGCGPLVDTAVHGFILDTRNYREFCDRHFGRFLEHIPAVEFKHDGSVERTAQIIAANGFAIELAAVGGRLRQVHPLLSGQCH
ncbi:hypothetical protein [Actinomadura sp. KC06]|uniref:hypothetical protein n=1 Tax=Actinomadura sp. KC06 TaxID=2530369 RepID=UPI001FB61F11|nr:hypothetical protein [Actinomadura sp. KC06]